MRWCQNGDCLRPVFPASRLQHMSDLHSKFALGLHCVEVWWTSNLRLLRLGEEKKRKIERNYRMKIYMVSLLHRATITILYLLVEYLGLVERMGIQSIKSPD